MENWFGYRETEACCLSFYSAQNICTVARADRVEERSSFWWLLAALLPSPLCHSVTSAGRRLSLPYLQWADTIQRWNIMSLVQISRGKKMKYWLIQKVPVKCGRITIALEESPIDWSHVPTGFGDCNFNRSGYWISMQSLVGSKKSALLTQRIGGGDGTDARWLNMTLDWDLCGLVGHFLLKQPPW